MCLPFFLFSSPMDSDSRDISGIIADTHKRFCRLPEEIAKRKQRERNPYMREYMREYRHRRHRVTLTFRPEDYRRVEKALEKSGYKVAVLLREAALSSLKFQPRYLIPKNLEESLHRLTLELRSAGNNLNQIARRVNTEKRANRKTLLEARQCLADMEAFVTRFVREPPLRS